jgi:hypothetical protein
LKKIAGSILTGISLLAEVVNEWMQHYFWAFANIAKGTSLLGGGSFDTPSRYADVLSFPYEPLNIFILTRVALWASIGFGLILIGWGLWGDMKK